MVGKGGQVENINTEEIKKELKESIFDDGVKMSLPWIGSIECHAMTHEDTEIFGQFCDYSGIHGEELKDLLIQGWLRILENGE